MTLADDSVVPVTALGEEPASRRRPGGFAYLWGATAFSALGDGVRLSALPLLVVSLTTDPALVSLAATAGWAPMLLSPVAGVLADRWDRRALLIATNLLRTAVLALLAVLILAGAADLWIVCAAALLLGAGETFFGIVDQSFLPMVVAPGRVTWANGRLQAAQLGFRDSVGQPLGGVLFVGLAAAPFLVNSAAFAVGVLLLLAVTAPGRAAPAAAPHESVRAMIATGFRFLLADRLLLLLAVMLGLLNFFATGVEALQALYVVKWLGMPASAFGLFLTAGAAGGVAGAMASTRLRTRMGLLPAALCGMALIGVSGLILGVGRNAVTAGVAFGCFGFGVAVYQTLTISLRQDSTPIAILGRVNGVYRFIGTGTAPLGALAAGVIGRAAGVTTPFLISGAGVLALAAVATVPLLRLGAGLER